MRRNLLLCLIITLSLVLGVTKGVLAFSFLPFDVPGADSTEANGINNNGMIVGGL